MTVPLMRRVVSGRLPVLIGVWLLLLQSCSLLEHNRYAVPGHYPPSNHWVPAQPAACSGCGGSGRGADYLAGQGFSPNTPGFRSSVCPRCGGSGRSAW